MTAGGGREWVRSLRRLRAMAIKEVIQMRRDRLTFAMMVGIPVMQLLLFGYAINMDPKGLPTAVLSADQSGYGRSIVAALQNTGYFEISHRPRTEAELDRLLQAGRIQFGVQVPAGFARAQATMSSEPVTTSPSSSTSTGTKLWPVRRLTSLRPLVTSGRNPKP